MHNNINTINAIYYRDLYTVDVYLEIRFNNYNTLYYNDYIALLKLFLFYEFIEVHCLRMISDATVACLFTYYTPLFAV